MLISISRKEVSMIENKTKLRVRYAETDQMGYVYYGNYAQYYEVGRVELLRSLGISYRKIEDEGMMMPVLDLNIVYKKPAFYDEELTIRTCIKEVPSLRIKFYYETFNEEGLLLNSATTTLVFVDKQTGKPCPMPPQIIEAIKKSL